METPAWIKELVELEVRYRTAKSLYENMNFLFQEFVMQYNDITHAHAGNPVYSHMANAVAAAHDHAKRLEEHIAQIKRENKYE